MSGRRSRARLYAVLALYQWQLTGDDPVQISGHYFDDPAWIGEVAESLTDSTDALGPGNKIPRNFDQELFKQLLYGVPANLQDVDRQLQGALDRPIGRVDPVECAILRVGAYELLYTPNVPYRAVINEAVDLAKLLGAEQGHRYVNGVLDRLARKRRTTEIRSNVPIG